MGGIPKLADIGLVIEMAEARSFVGTEGFIPPEGPNSSQADLYSLGKVLYEAGMGKDRKDFPEPFTHLAEAPDATEILEFNAVLLKACAANREERYQSAEGMNADLALLQSGGSVRRQRKLTSQLRFVQRAGALVTNRPAEEEIHRIRIQQTLNQLPRLLRVVSSSDGRHIASGAFSPDGKWVATASWPFQVRIWSTDTAVDRFPPLRFPQTISGVRFTPDGRRLIAQSTRDPAHAYAGPREDIPGFAAVLDAATGEALYPAITNATQTVLSPDARWLAVARPDGSVSLIATADGQEVTKLIGHQDGVLALAFSEESDRLVTGGADRMARVWRIPSGEPEGPALEHDEPVIRAVFQPGGRQLATVEHIVGDRDVIGRVSLWDVVRGQPSVVSKQTGSGEQTDGRVWALFFDPVQGNRLFVGMGNAVEVGDADSFAEFLPPLKMRSVARCWAFSPDGSMVAVGSDDGTARIWDLQRGALMFPPFHHSGWVESVRFSPDD